MVNDNAGTISLLDRSIQRALLKSAVSVLNESLPIRASLSKSVGSSPILTPVKFNKVEHRVKMSSTDWHTGTLSAQSSQ